MTLHVYRSQRAEELVASLASVLERSWPADPFEPLPIVVGSRGMERWLRHELATRLGALAAVDFVFPGAAFEGAAAWLLSSPEPGSRELYWRRPRSAASPWSGARLELAVLAKLRARLGEPDFAPIRRYLREGSELVTARELGFAREVARAIERLLRDRAADAVAWADGEAPEEARHAWLARLVADLDADASEPLPARQLRALERLQPAPRDRPLVVFGLSTLPVGDRQRVAALARHLELHFFTLAPSSAWWQDIHSHRAREQARGAGESAELEALLARNALLAANGEPSRELQAWLEESPYVDALPEREAGAPRQLLEALHQWIDRAGDNPRHVQGEPNDEARAFDGLVACESIQLHACHGALRQCEALRDELLRRFAADPTLEPRHVLVMTPDVATYGPLAAAVFARSQGAPAIPLHVADLGIRATNPVAEVLLGVLALGAERVTASGIAALSSLAPLRARFELDDTDLGELSWMIEASGMRWAWDAEDRAAHEQPRVEQNTLRFGLERLALGVLMPDEGGLEVAPSPGDPERGPIVPLELATRERVERFGRFAELCKAVELEVRTLREPGTLASWQARLSKSLDALTLVSGSAAWQRVQVAQVLAELLPVDAEPELRFERGAIEAALRGAFELPQRGDRPTTGAVTLSALEPMRSVPFRVIAMLGLDDRAFPRVSRPPAWDPFAKKRPGEHDRRTIDRHLFLESVLCARDALLLFGNGFEPKGGERAPMSVVLSELAELLEGAFGLAPGAFVVEHPLQPWSEAAFAEPSASRQAAGASRSTRPAKSYDAQWAASARARGNERRAPAGLAATELGALMPPDESAASSLDAWELARALAKPQEELARRRLGLSLALRDEALADREPLELDGLDDYGLREQALSMLAGGGELDLAAWEARIAGEGRLPMRAGGRRVLGRIRDEARTVLGRLERLGARVQSGQLSLATTASGVLIGATVPELRQSAEGPKLCWPTARRSVKGSALAQMQVWVSLLVARASGHEVERGVVVGVGDELELGLPAGLDAQAALGALLALRARVRSETLLLFPKLSLELVAARRSAKRRLEDRALVRSRRGVWEGNGMDAGDRDDPWVGALFGHLSIDDLADRATELLELAESVWGPVFDARPQRAGKGGKSTEGT